MYWTNIAGVKQRESMASKRCKMTNSFSLGTSTFLILNDFHFIISGTLTFKSKYATKTFEELLCCPFPKASCCTHNKCCPSDKPICGCPDPTGVPEYCCPAAFPICRAGKCYRADGAMSKGEPALTHQ